MHILRMDWKWEVNDVDDVDQLTKDAPYIGLMCELRIVLWEHFIKTFDCVFCQTVVTCVTTFMIWTKIGGMCIVRALVMMQGSNDS